MQKFILRNKQIFITGAVIGGLFLLIIISSSLRKTKGPTLSPSTQNSQSSQEAPEGTNPGSNYKPKGTWSAPLPMEAYVEENDSTEEEQPSGEEPKQILEIVFDDKGFSPMNARALINQTVRWTNKSAKKIEIFQMKNFFPEFENPVEIESNGSLEFKLTKLGLWGYKEKESDKMGSIFILTRISP
jgi:hypothetical protein